MDAGKQLIANGWEQGKLIPAGTISVPWFRRSESGDWVMENTALLPDDYLVVVSHDCEIERDEGREPRIEFMRAFWTDKKSEINDASPSAIRRFKLRQRIGADGRTEGLVADATATLFIDKRSLLEIDPAPGLDESDHARQRFRIWLAARRNRPSVPNPLQAAFVAPIEDAIKKLKEGDQIRDILTGIDEILYAVVSETPYKLDVIYLPTEASGITPADLEQAATLTDWINGALERAGGHAHVEPWDRREPDDLSIREYRAYTPLRLDYLSLPEPVERAGAEASPGATPDRRPS
jgi:hypothetical protein